MGNRRNPDEHGDGMMGTSDRSGERMDTSSRSTERTSTGDRANLGEQVRDRDAGDIERESEQVAQSSRVEREGLHDDAETRRDSNSMEPDSER